MRKRSRSWDTSSDLVAKWTDWLYTLNESDKDLRWRPLNDTIQQQLQLIDLLMDDLEDLVAAVSVCTLNSEDVAIWTRVKRLDRKWANLNIGCSDALIDSQSSMKFRCLLKELTGFFLEQRTNEKPSGLLGWARKIFNWVYL